MKHVFPALALSVALVIPLAGDPVERLPDATLLELAQRPAPPPMAKEVRHAERRRRAGLESVTSSEHIAAGARVIASAEGAPPPVVASFASDTSRILSPADASGAVGPDHVVSASNNGIVVHHRDGTKLTQLSLTSFWSGATFADVYDPRITYDAAADRWVTVAIRNEASLLLAVSGDGNPTGTWSRYSIALDGCDFSRIALTRDSVLVATVVGESGYQFVFSFLKNILYTRPATLAYRQTSVPGSAMVVHAPDLAAEYVVMAGLESLAVRRIDSGALPVWRYYHAGFDWDDAFGAKGQQRGSNNRLDLGYSEVEAASMRGDAIYAVHRVGSGPRTPDGNALLLWKVKPDETEGAEVHILDGAAAYSYPALAVNRLGGVLVAYSTMSSTTYPSTAYAYLDPSGRLTASRTLRDGDSAILNTDRWGDYTTVVDDPRSDRDFWAMQISSANNAWQTWWSQIRVPASKRRLVRR
jgi:hypothetical protein